MSTIRALLTGVLFCGALALVHAGILTSCESQAATNQEGECAKRVDKCSIVYTAKWHEAFEKDAIGHTKGAIWWFGERHDYR